MAEPSIRRTEAKAYFGERSAIRERDASSPAVSSAQRSGAARRATAACVLRESQFAVSSQLQTSHTTTSPPLNCTKHSTHNTANERTFLHWLNMAVTIGSVAAAMSGVAGHAHRKWGDDYMSGAVVVRLLSLVMLVLSIVIAVWAGYNFNHRANMLT